MCIFCQGITPYGIVEISNCEKIKILPDLSHTEISSISIFNCNNLETISGLPPTLKIFNLIHNDKCTEIDFSGLLRLVDIELYDCTKLKSLQLPPNLETLDISASKIKVISDLPRSLKDLISNFCVYLKSICLVGSQVWRVRCIGCSSLVNLELSDQTKTIICDRCPRLKLNLSPDVTYLSCMDCNFETLEIFENLDYLNVSRCLRLHTIIGSFENLKQFYGNYCRKLVNIPEIPKNAIADIIMSPWIERGNIGKIVRLRNWLRKRVAQRRLAKYLDLKNYFYSVISNQILAY